MRKKGKYLVALALVLAVALGWTGLQLVSGQEVYHAPELVLLEGQADYDLLSGIEYDAGQYALNLADDGGFDVDTLGTYTLRYELTPQSAPSKEPVAEGTEQPAPPQEPVVEETESPAEPISFTRQVMVKEAVSYDDVRLEQGSQDLLGGIATASQDYQISVVTDGGFDPNQVEEYEVTYSLRRADNGKELRKFSRYIQVTQPGVEFTAPELVAQGDVTGRDWLDGIEYDHSQYTLTLLTQPDIANQQPQRLRYSLTRGDTVVAVFGREVTILGGTQAAEPSQAPASVPGQDQPTANGVGDTPATLEYTGNLLLTLPSGTAADYTTAVEVFQAIAQVAGAEAAGTYRVDLLKDYTWTAADQAALTALTGLEAGDTLTLTGDPKQTGAGVYKMTFNSYFVLPMKSAATYKIEYIVAQGGYLIANGSPLILGEGMNITGANVFGGGYLTGSEKFEGNTNLTILSGSYSWVGAGSLGETTLVETTGDNHLTIGGGQSTVQITQLVGLNCGKGSGYDYTHTGSSTVDLLKNSVVERVFASNKSFYDSTLTATAKSNVQTGGTITISAHEGSSIGYMLEGTENYTYSGTAELDTVVFVLAGTHEIFGLHSFDYLILEENAQLTGSSLNADARMVTSVGEVIFRANSTFILEGPMNNARCGSLKTEGENALFAVGRSVTLTSDQPMDASGGPLGLKFDDDTREPGNGHNVLETTAPISPQDFICKVPQPGFTTANAPDGTDIRFVWTYVQLTTPSGAVSEWGSTAQAYQEIARVAGTEAPGTYRVDLLKDYTWTAADQAALTALTGLEAGDTLTLTGDPQKTGAGVYTLTLVRNTDMVFPPSSPASYRVEQIKISGGTRTIDANGSTLTMGEGITVTGTLDVVGGGHAATNPTGDTYTFTGDTNLTLLSGTYRYVAAGSRPYASGWTGTVTTQGHNHLTLGGGTGTVTVTDVMGLNLIGYGSSNITNSHTGSSTITLNSGATVTNLYAGSRGDTYNAYHTDVQTDGTITVQVNGGQIKTLLGGTVSTKANAGQLGQVVFQINGAQTIPTVQDFDQLVLAEKAHLTVSTKLHYKVKEVEAAGQVVFGANSQLTAPAVAVAGLTVGSLKTVGEGAVLEITKNYRLYVDAADAPMDASGGALGIKYKTDAAPAKGNILVQYNNAKGEADRKDYAYKFPQEGFMLSADPTNGYIMLDEANIRLTTPSGAVTQWITAAEAYQEIARVAGTEQPGAYRMDLLRNYTWTAADQAALTGLTGLEKGDTLTLTGDPQNTGAGVYGITFSADVHMVYPSKSPAEYRMEQIKLVGINNLSLIATVAANGSHLTMGEGIAVTSYVNVVGGGILSSDTSGGTYTFNGDTNLTILSGTYWNIAAGSFVKETNWNGTVTTQGNNNLTVGGGSGTVLVNNCVIGLNLMPYGTGQSTTIHTGNSNVIVDHGVTVTYHVYAGSRGVGNYTQGQSHTDVQKNGTLTVQVKAGAVIKKTLGGTSSTTADAGQLERVVFQMYETDITNRVDRIDGFDQLILTSGANIYTMYMDYDSSGAEEQAEGQIVFQENATLRTNFAGRAGSIKTEGAGATLEVHSSNYHMKLDGEQPMDSSGGALTVKYWYTVPANNLMLLNYTNPKAPTVEPKDFISGHTDYPQFLLTTDETGKYLIYYTAKVQMTAPTTSGGEVTKYPSFAEAFKDLKRMKEQGVTGAFTVALLMDYGGWSTFDRAALLAVDNLTAADSVTITGRANPDASEIFRLDLDYELEPQHNPVALELPEHSKCPFTIEYMNFSGGGAYGAVVANGTSLTMGEGIGAKGTSYNYLTVVGGGISQNEEFDPATNYTFTGDTNLTIKSGSYYRIVGGNLGLTLLEEDCYVTLDGSVNLTIDGTVRVGPDYSNCGVNGGNYFVGGEPGKGHSTITGDINFTIRGDFASEENTITLGADHRHGGKIASDQVDGTATLTLLADEAGKKPAVTTIYGSTHETAAGGNPGVGKLNQSIIVFDGEYTIPNIYDFDQLVLKENAHLSVTNYLVSQRVEAETPAGQVVFGANSIFSPSTDRGSVIKVGSLKTAGEGAILEIIRSTAGRNPLVVEGTVPTDVTAGKLTVRYNPSSTPAANGDQVIYFKGQPNLADASCYLSGFPYQPGLVHNKTSGYVIVATNIVSLQTNGGKEVYYPSVAAAMDEIERVNNSANAYIVTVRMQHYGMTEEDLAAIDQFNGAAASITFTSTFALTADDILESGEKVGQTVTRHVVIDGDLSFRSDTTMQNIYLEYQGHDGSETTTVSHNIYANGHPLTMGVGVDTGSGNYPTLYGGSKTEAVTGTTNLTVQSGTYEDIYGGGQQGGASVTGTNIRYEEFAVLNGSLYGGGKAGDVNGDVSVVISGGTTGGQTDSKVIAGGETGNVSGTAQLTISGGTAGKTMVVAGADNGTVVNAAISILEPSSGSEPSAPKAHVYGGAYGSGSVTGTASVTIGNGTYYGTISGGDLDGGMPDSSTISFSGSELKMENLVNFSTLNLGYGGNKCNLSVTGQLDSNTTAGDNFGRTGQMIFNSGSILNLTGKSAHKVGSIQTTTTGGASHLHISKAEGVSYPLYISKGNNSEKGYTINVGIPDSESAPAGSRPAEGDDVLIFAQADQVDMSQYLCGLTMLSLVQNADNPAIVELGIASEVQAKLTAVTHNGKADTATAGSNKTLSFLFTNVSDAGVAGPVPTSAYIDRSATADSGWAAGGQVPAGALGGELTSFTPVEGQQGQWTGQITLDVEALDSESPQFYYLHVRGAPGFHRTIILDVYGPQVNKDVTSSGNGQGDYTFTIQVQDKAPAGTSSNPEDENAPVYENAGLYQVGWSLTEHDPKALTKPMTVEGVQTISDDNVWLPYDWTFEVTAEQLAQAGGVGDNKVIYLYFKDTLGNTRMIAVPMSEHQMDVSIPTRVGVVAMKGVDTPKVNAPQCALINYGSQALNASVTQVSFTAKDNELTLVAKPGSPNSAFGKKEIDLRIKPLAGEQGYAYSLANLTTPQAQPLSMGQMAAYASEGTANQIGFTFDALYNPQTIVETSNWSMFYLSYRFEAVGSTTAP